MSASPPSKIEGIGREKSWDLLRLMLRIRRFEEKAAELYGESKIRGFLHLYIGEEAVACGPPSTRESCAMKYVGRACMPA